MKRSIKLTIDIDPSIEEPEVIIKSNKESSLIKKIASIIQQYTEQERPPILAYRDDTEIMVDQLDIIRVYVEQRRLVVCTHEGRLQMKCTLRELEGMLDSDWFVRISRYEIINLNWVANFDLSFKGTIKVVFEDGNFTWVSRRFVGSVEYKLEDLSGWEGAGDE